jgi:hypothetical protein
MSLPIPPRRFRVVPTFPPGPAPAPTRKRERRHRCDYLYVRKVAGRKYQARVWLPAPLGSINLGLYDDERSAWHAVRQWIRAGADPCDNLPEGVLPKWVKVAPDGSFFGIAKMRFCVIRMGPFATPQECHRAMFARVAARTAYDKAIKRMIRASRAARREEPSV